ncbi:MAG: PEGA domain-containing protein [Cuniculiplasma sp.]
MSKVESVQKIFAILIVIGFILVGVVSIMGTGHQGNGINGPSNSTFPLKTNNPQLSSGQSVNQGTKDTSVNINHVVPRIIKSQKDAAIKGNYTLTLVEKGLPSGSLWNATTSYCYLSNTGMLIHANKTNSSKTTKIGFSLVNGSYDFKVKSNGYGGNAPFYSIPIKGKSTTFNVSFSKAYDVKFVEKGLPSGSLWNAFCFNYSYGLIGINSSNGNELNALLTNGTYTNFKISGKGFDAYMGKYTQSLYGGGIEYNYSSFTVNGKGFTINVTFSRLYEVNFIESGLPSVNSWIVFIHYNSSGYGIGNAIVNSTVYSKPLINGTYSYCPSVCSQSLSSMNGYAAPSGTIKVAGKNATVNITFSKSSTSNYYTVIFTETGLPSGTPWSVTFNGYSSSSKTSANTFSALSGTYSYTIGLAGIYRAKPDNGTITVSANISVPITFSKLPSSPGNAKVFESLFPVGSYFNYVQKVVAHDNITFTNGTTIPKVMTNSTVFNYSIIAISNYIINISCTQTGTNSKGNKFTQTTYMMTPTADIYNWAHYTLFSNQNTPALLFLNTSDPGSSVLQDTISHSVGATSVSLFGRSYNAYKVLDNVKVSNDGFLGNISYNMNYAKSNGLALLGNINFKMNINTPYYEVKANAELNISLTATNAASLNASVHETKYQVTFTETGLPSGTSWSVIFNGSTQSSTTNTISFTAANGTYIYTIGLISGYKVSINNGKITVKGASQNIPITFTLKSLETNGYIKGTVSPGSATVTIDGRLIQVTAGHFNISLLPGTYYLSFSARGYNSSVREVNLRAGEGITVNVVLTKISNAVTLSGYITPDNVNASIVINNIIVDVNSTGHFSQTVAPGTYTISAYANGYYPYSKNVTVSTSTTVDIALVKEPNPTSGTHNGNVKATGFNVTVSNLLIGKGNVTLSFNSRANGTLVVQVPFKDVGNATISEILNSTVYINGTQYKDFTITISSNYTVILKVYGLSSRDPTLYWGYSPYSTAPKSTSITPTTQPNVELYEIIAAVVLIGIIVGIVGMVIRKKK